MVKRKIKGKVVEMAAESKPKGKVGRPKRKSRTGLPLVGVLEAIGFVKKAYQSVGRKEKPFSSMHDAMGMKPAFAKSAFGILANNYGLLELKNGAWQITSLGERVVNGDKDAVIDAMKRIPILDELYTQMKDRNADRDLIEDYINRKRAKLNAEGITTKYLEIIDYINSLTATNGKQEISSGISSRQAEMIRLMYSLFPIGKDEDVHSQLDRLIEISKENNFTELVKLLMGAKPFIKSHEDLKRISKDAVKDFESATGLVLYPKEKESQRHPKHADSAVENEEE